MRILDIRPDNARQDIEAGQRVLAQEVGHPAHTVMVIRGNSPDVGQFADRAAVRSDAFAWRETVWVKADGILTDSQTAVWFGNDERLCAVVLDFGDKPSTQLKSDATLYEIEQAFLKAQQGGGQ